MILEKFRFTINPSKNNLEIDYNKEFQTKMIGCFESKNNFKTLFTKAIFKKEVFETEFRK